MQYLIAQGGLEIQVQRQRIRAPVHQLCGTSAETQDDRPRHAKMGEHHLAELFRLFFPRTVKSGTDVAQRQPLHVPHPSFRRTKRHERREYGDDMMPCIPCHRIAVARRSRQRVRRAADRKDDGIRRDHIAAL